MQHFRTTGLVEHDYCPTRLAVEIIAEKWAVIVLFALSLEPRRPGDLAELGATLVEPIKVLTDWARDHGEAIVDYQENNQP